MSRIFWATEPTEKLGAEIERKIVEYNAYLLSIGRWELWRRAMRLVYGSDPDSGRQTSRVTFGGKEGEIVQARGNTLMKLLRSYHTLVYGSRPAFEPRTIADDSAATETSVIGRALLDYALSKRRIESAWKRGGWYVLTCGEGWVYTPWNKVAGRAVMVDEAGQPVHEGDIDSYELRPDEVVRDVSSDGQQPHDWLILRTQRNRWTCAAQFPDWAAHIAETTMTTQLDQQRQMCFRPEDTSRDRGHEDTVDVYELYVACSPALPEGRYSVWIGGKVVFDDINALGRIPCAVSAPNRVVGQPLGYSHLWDLLGLQQCSDAALTALVTVTENFGLPTIWAPPGVDNGSPIQMAGGMRLVRSTLPPQLLEQMGTAPAQLQAVQDHYYQAMLLTSGLNDVAVGDAGKSQSGAALAMQHSLAKQDSSDYHAAATQQLEDIGNIVLESYKLYASTERVITISGNGKRGMAIRFNKERLSVLDGVDMNIGSPMTQTAAGRYEIMQALLAAKVISAEQFLEGLASGTIEPITEAPLNHRVLIESENERLRRGEPVRALATDRHAQHIREHLIVLDDQDVRLDDALAGAVLTHVQEHVQLWVQVSQAQPDLLMATGQPPAPSVVAAQQAMAAAAQAQAQAAKQPPGSDAQPGEGGPMEDAPDMPQMGAGGGVMPGGAAGDLPDMPQVPTA
jgi:hypothetical protein